jgi:hypothetical protein
VFVPDGDGRAMRLPAVVDGRSTVIVATAHHDQVALIVREGRTIEIQADVFRGMCMALNIQTAALPKGR